MASVRLFVYGSLKRGGQHHEELRGARFLGAACTAPGFALVASGPYWALVGVPDQSSTVPGELFEVDAELLPALDAFEGAGYVRGEVPLGGLPGAANAPAAAALAYFKKSD